MRCDGWRQAGHEGCGRLHAPRGRGDDHPLRDARLDQHPRMGPRLQARACQRHRRVAQAQQAQRQCADTGGAIGREPARRQDGGDLPRRGLGHHHHRIDLGPALGGVGGPSRQHLGGGDPATASTAGKTER